MNYEHRSCFFLQLNTGVSTAFLVHPHLLATALHSSKGATKGVVFSGDRKRVGNIAKVYEFENLPQVDIAFIEMKEPIQAAQLAFSMKKNQVGDKVTICGYPYFLKNEFTSVTAKVCRVTDDEVLYDLPKQRIKSHTDLNGASGSPVFKEGTSYVDAVHLGSYISEPAGSLPITGYAISSWIVFELLRSLVGNNLGK